MLTEYPPPLARMEECPSSQLKYRLYQPWATLSLQSGLCDMELDGLAHGETHYSKAPGLAIATDNLYKSVSHNGQRCSEHNHWTRP
jgi:hypothetical protein